jgi:hypothetical protein
MDLKKTLPFLPLVIYALLILTAVMKDSLAGIIALPQAHYWGFLILGIAGIIVFAVNFILSKIINKIKKMPLPAPIPNMPMPSMDMLVPFPLKIIKSILGILSIVLPIGGAIYFGYAIFTFVSFDVFDVQSWADLFADKMSEIMLFFNETLKSFQSNAGKLGEAADSAGISI